MACNRDQHTTSAGVGRTADLTDAGEAVRAALRQQRLLFTAAQQRELSEWVRDDKVFKALADHKEATLQPPKPKRPRTEPARPVPAPAAKKQKQQEPANRKAPKEDAQADGKQAQGKQVGSHSQDEDTPVA